MYAYAPRTPLAGLPLCASASLRQRQTRRSRSSPLYQAAFLVRLCFAIALVCLSGCNPLCHQSGARGEGCGDPATSGMQRVPGGACRLCLEKPRRAMRNFGAARGWEDGKPALRLRGGGGGGDKGMADDWMRYRTKWSETHRSSFLELSGDRLTATCPEESWDGEDMEALMAEGPDTPEAWSVRADDPIPPGEGQHYFEIVFRMPGMSQGQMLWDGWNTAGLVSSAESRFEGMWWSKQDMVQHTYGLHDSQLLAFGYKSDPNYDVERWAEGGSFGHGDRIGFLVDSTSHSALAFKNGVLLGKAFDNLPDLVFPYATLVSERVTAEILFPDPPDAAYLATAEPRLIFGTKGTRGSAMGVCTKPGHSARGCYGLCNLTEVVGAEEAEKIMGPDPTPELAKLQRWGNKRFGLDAMQRGKDKLKSIMHAKMNNSKPGHEVEIEEESAMGRGGFVKCVEEAPNYAVLKVKQGRYKWQLQQTCLWADEEMMKNASAVLFDEDDIIRTWHWYDALVMPKGCGAQLIGESKQGCVLWGRWQLRNQTEGAIRGATLLSEPPLHEDCTMDVWGCWEIEDCNIRCAGGSVLDVDYQGHVSVLRSSVGGDGRGSRRARRAVQVKREGTAILKASNVSFVGLHGGSCALTVTHRGNMELTQCAISDIEMVLRIDWEARACIRECDIREADVCVFYARDSKTFNQLQWAEINGEMQDDMEGSKDQARNKNELDDWDVAFYEPAFEDSLEANSSLTLSDTTIHLNPMGKFSLWGTEGQAQHWHQANITFIKHPEHYPPPLPLPTPIEFFNDTTPLLDAWLRVHHPEYMDKVGELRRVFASERGKQRRHSEESAMLEERDRRGDWKDDKGRRRMDSQGRLRCVQGSDCMFQYMDKSHAAKYDHTPLKSSQDDKYYVDEGEGDEGQSSNGDGSGRNDASDHDDDVEERMQRLGIHDGSEGYRQREEEDEDEGGFQGEREEERGQEESEEGEGTGQEEGGGGEASDSGLGLDGEAGYGEDHESEKHSDDGAESSW